MKLIFIYRFLLVQNNTTGTVDLFSETFCIWICPAIMHRALKKDTHFMIGYIQVLRIVMHQLNLLSLFHIADYCCRLLINVYISVYTKMVKKRCHPAGKSWFVPFVLILSPSFSQKVTTIKHITCLVVLLVMSHIYEGPPSGVAHLPSSVSPLALGSGSMGELSFYRIHFGLPEYIHTISLASCCG